MSQHTHPNDDGKPTHDSIHSPLPGEASEEMRGEMHEEMGDPTIVFLIPYPHLKDTASRKHDSAPFLIYAPLQQRLVKPAKGEKESLPHKAMRKWQTEEVNAEEKGTGLKAKTVKLIGKGMSATKNSGIEFLVRTPKKDRFKELRIFYPSGYPPENMQSDFTALIKHLKRGARKNSIIATTLMPFALAFDTITFIPGPFEITTVWAASSWTGTARATSIANGLNSQKVPIILVSTTLISALTFRLHELCWHQRPDAVAPASMQETPKRGAELAGVLLDCLKGQLGEELENVDVERDRRRLGSDVESILAKAAKEWGKSITRKKAPT
jgi:hypothetical protein